MTDDWKKDSSFFDFFLAQEVPLYALHFMQTGNTGDAKLFFQGLENYNLCDGEESETYARTFLETLLRYDQLGMVQTLVDDDQIHYWCGNNQRHVINQCPQLFSWWDHQHKFERVAAVLDELAAEQKEAVVRGCGTTKAQEYFYEQLRGDPLKWKILSPSWVGVESSSMRQAALDLGWSLSLVPDMMLHERWELAINQWRGVTSYPYSVYLLAALMGVEDPNEYDNYGHIRFFKTVNELRNDRKVHFLDAALTAVLVNRAPQVNAAFSGTPFYIQTAIPQASPEQKAYLAHLVDVHIGLDALPHLAKMVLNNDFMEMHQPDTAALPELGMAPI